MGEVGDGGGGERRARESVGGAPGIKSLRVLGSVLGRRFSPRGIPGARALEQAATLGLALRRPLRSLHTLRNLDAGDGAIGALAAAGGIATLIGILYSKEDESCKETMNVVTDVKALIDDPALRAKFMDEDGKVAWLEYLDYINFVSRHPEVTDKKVHDEMIQRRYPKEAAVKQEDVSVSEPAMKARFEEWMKEYGRTYRTEEEKATRYEIFKMAAISSDKANASTKASARWAPNNLADRTWEELYGPEQTDSDWEYYFDSISRLYAEGRIKDYPRKVGWTDAAKESFKKLKARMVEQDSAAECAAATRKDKKGC